MRQYSGVGADFLSDFPEGVQESFIFKARRFFHSLFYKNSKKAIITEDNLNPIISDSDFCEPRINSEHLSYSELIRKTDVCSIPDVHGDISALKMSLYSMELIDSDGRWIGGNKVVQFLGDYIDRGTSSLEVLDFLSRLRPQAEEVGGSLKLLLGNHETIMIGAIVDFEHYRELWLYNNNGGNSFKKEFREKYPFESEDDFWKQMRQVFMDGGEYSELISSMEVASQVDDVLYLHGGISTEWIDVIANHDIDALNQMWKATVSDLKQGNFGKMSYFAHPKSPLWFRYGHYAFMKDEEIYYIVDVLKKQGINAVVVGHDPLKNPEINERFMDYGIKMIATDTSMSSAYGEASSQAGIMIDKKGNIYGQSRIGAGLIHVEGK